MTNDWQRDLSSPNAEDYPEAMRSPMGQPVMSYNPTRRLPGIDYWQVGRLLYIIERECRVPKVQELVQEALLRHPEGYELRNEYLNPIRVAMQEWRVGYTLSSMVKGMLQMLLIDTRDGKLAIESLTMDTLMAYDPSGQFSIKDRYSN
jgi:hypothetical protein